MPGADKPPAPRPAPAKAPEPEPPIVEPDRKPVSATTDEEKEKFEKKLAEV